MNSRLGELLVRHGSLRPEQLEEAAEQQRQQGGALSRHLVKLGLISEEDLLGYLQREYRLPVVDPLSLDIPRDVLDLVPIPIVEPIWSSPLALIVCLVLLTAEWIGRRLLRYA